MRIAIFFILALAWGHSKAQLNPIPTTYHFNSFQGNPAMAGQRPGMEINGAIKAQWSHLDGAPVMQSLTASYRPKDGRVGLGIRFYDEKAGILRQNELGLAYCYYLPLDDYGNSLGLGLSLSMLSQSVIRNKARGDLTDPTLGDYINPKAQVDGDFGLSLNLGRLTVQGAAPQLKSRVTGKTRLDEAGKFLYLGAVSYQIILYDFENTLLEPMFMYRHIKHMSPLWDAGVKAVFSGDKLDGSLIYHSTGSITAGIGFTYQRTLCIFAAYTSNSWAMQQYANGAFTLGIRYSLLNPDK